MLRGHQLNTGIKAHHVTEIQRNSARREECVMLTAVVIGSLMSLKCLGVSSVDTELCVN